MTAVDGIAALGPEPRTPNNYTGPPTPPPLRPPDVNQAASADRNFSFGDFIDVINPLQHIPGVAEVYRAVTNDQISDQARKTGNTIYGIALGGPVGLGVMLAYNALGDRLETAKNVATPTPNPEAIAQTESVEQITVGDIKISTVPEGIEISTETKPDAQPILGNKVASTGTIGPGNPLNLAEVLGGNSKSAETSKNAPDSVAKSDATKASSVAYVELSEEPEKPGRIVPDETGLDRLATHKSNHLPLDVLRAMQERHAERSAS
ncbi:MAG: hypothetical protein ABJQ71_02825 [Roseibium sp.]